MSKYINHAKTRGSTYLGFTDKIIPRLTHRERLMLRWVEIDYRLASRGSCAPDFHAKPLLELERIR